MYSFWQQTGGCYEYGMGGFRHYTYGNRGRSGCYAYVDKAYEGAGLVVCNVYRLRSIAHVVDNALTTTCTYRPPLHTRHAPISLVSAQTRDKGANQH